ncbi:unnamed protein product [Nippostrongylus brasiliensis]|uniref:Protein CASC3 n=1 Tax=Nippostrongylus brasiliensis TaxID=27835 RepID=A0A0N4YLX3_NIPBR|nr:unnamed protein product [Nippostrongylus brasiliensis]
MVMEAVPTDSAVSLESRAGAKALPSSAGGDPQTFTCTDGDGADKEKPSGNPTKGSREGIDEVGTAEVVTAKLQKVLKKKQRDPTDVDTEETKYERRRRKRRVRSLEEESTQPWIGSCEDIAEQNHPTQDSQQGSRASSPERRNEKIEMPGWTVEQITQSLMSQRRFEEMTTAKPPKSPLRDRDQYRSTGTSAAASPAKSPMKGSAEASLHHSQKPFIEILGHDHWGYRPP